MRILKSAVVGTVAAVAAFAIIAAVQLWLGLGITVTRGPEVVSAPASSEIAVSFGTQVEEEEVAVSTVPAAIGAAVALLGGCAWQWRRTRR